MLTKRYVLRLAALVPASWATQGAAQPPNVFATVPPGQTPMWWTRNIALTPKGDRVDKLKLTIINAALRKKGNDQSPFCAIERLSWGAFASDDPATQAMIREAAVRYSGAFVTTMASRPGKIIKANVVAIRRCGETDAPGLAILTASTSGKFDDLAAVPWPFVRFRPVTAEAVSIFNCLDCLGSGLIDQSQKMTVAARAMAEKKAVGQRS